MKNPLFKAGIKTGTRKLGGVGVEKKIRLRDIRSSQALVTDSKVKKMKGKSGKMPPVTVAHAGRGKYWLSDGNNRAVAALLSGKRKINALVQKLSSPSPLIQFSRIGQAIRKYPKTAIAAGTTAGVAIGASASKAAGELHKHAWNEHQPDRGGRSPEEIAAHYKKLYPTAYLSGSSALKIGVPGSSDVDVHIPTRSVKAFKKVERRLLKTLEPSAYYKPGYDHAGFTGKMDGRPIDVAVTYGEKGFQKRDAIRRVAAELTDDQRAEIIATKQKLKKAWIAPEARYHAYKRGLDIKHGIPLWRAEKLPEQQMQARRKPIQFEDDLQLHQQRVIRRLLHPKTSGLVVAHGVGSGKTRTSIEAHKALGGDADVVLPAALRGNYEKEMTKWNGDPESAHIQSQQALATSGEPLKSKLLIVDEAHRARNPQTKLAKAITESPAKKRMLLTGTPIYNRPSDIATLVNQAAGKPVLREGKAFDNRYLKPGIFKRWTGGRLSNERELKDAFSKYVDYHKGDPTYLPKVTAKTIPVDMGKRQTELYRASMGKIPKGVKVNKENIDKLKAYFTGPRQVSNTSNSLEPGSNEEPKIDRAFNDLKTHLANPKGKALVYSNWLEHGIAPMRQRLEKEGISHGIFTGDENMKVRNQTIRDYNEGKHRALLVSSSGAEGLDLKGTRMVQVLEPHFNNAKLRQVVGRSARMNSHAHLDPEDRNVEVRQYIGRPRNRFLPGTGKGVEDMLSESARDKDEVEKQITRLFKSKRKLIEFALPRDEKGKLILKPGDMAAKALAGTPIMEPENQKIFKALAKKSVPAYKTALGTGVASVGATQVPRDTDVGIERGSKESLQIHRSNLARQALTGRAIRNKVISEATGPTTGMSGFQRAKAREQAQQKIEKQLPATVAGVRANLNDKKVYGPHPTIPDMVAERDGTRVPGLVSGEREKYQARATKMKGILHHQIKTKLRAEPDFQPGGKWHTEDVRYRKGVEEELGRRANQYLEGSIDKPAVAERAFNKPLSPENIIKNKASQYGPLAEVLGIPQEKVEKIHGRYLGRKNPEPQRLIKTILASPGREAFAEVKIPKRSSGLPTSFPTLKNVGIGAGILGAGLLANKLLRKKEEQKMSSRGRLIRFSKITKASDIMAGIAKLPAEKKAYARRILAKAKAGVGVVPAPMPAALPEYNASLSPKAKWKQQHRLQRYIKKSPVNQEGLDRAIAEKQLGEAFEARKAAAKGSTEPAGPTLPYREDAKSAGQRERETYLAGQAEFRRKQSAERRADLPIMNALIIGGPKLGDFVTRDVAERHGIAKAGRAVKQATRLREARSAAQSKAHSEEVSGIKSSIKKKLLIGTSAGLGTGAGLTYIATRPPKELEFSARKIPAFSLNAAKKNIKHVWDNSNTAQKIAAPVAYVAGQVVDGVVAAATKGWSLLNPASASKVLPVLAHKALKSRERADLLGRSLGGFTKQRAGNADGYFIPQKLHAKGNILRFERKKEAPAWQKAAISSAVSGGAFGLIPAFRKTSTGRQVLKSVATGAGLGASLGGGGTYIGTKIMGDPSKKDPVAITKRAALGGSIAGLGLGAAAVLALRRGKKVPGIGTLNEAAKEWRPAGFIQRAPAALAVSSGGIIGGLTAGAYAADEGQQVDTMRNLKKPVRMSSRSPIIRLASGDMPLTGKLAADRYRKKIQDEDLDRRDANILRTAGAGAILGGLIRGKKGALIGAAAGAPIVPLIRSQTASGKDMYGDRSRQGKQAEGLPWKLAGLGAAGVLAHKGNQKLTAAKIGITKWGRRAKMGALGAAGLWAASKMFSSNGSNDLIRFDDVPEAPEGYRLVKHTKVKPRHWTKKWLADDINIDRRSADLRTYTNRASATLKDIGGALKGEAAVDARGRPRKREWDKPWANALKWTAVVGATAAGVKGVKHMAENPGVMADAAEFVRQRGIQKAISNTLRKSKTISNAMDWVGDKATKMKNEGKGFTESIASRVLGKFKKAAGDIPTPKHYDIPTPAGGFRRVMQGEADFAKHHESLLTPENRALAQAARAKKKADEIAIKNQGLKKDPHTFSAKSNPIQFQKLSKGDYEDEIAAYQQETGKEFRPYHLNGPTVRHAALHPSVVQRKPRDPNKDSNEQRKWRARYKMAGAFVLGTGLGAFGFKRPGVVTKNSAPILASSKDPLIELNSLLDSALL